MKQPSSSQMLAACVAVACLAAWSLFGFYSATEGLAGPNADVYKIGQQAARFQDLKSALPATGIVGYVTDAPTDQTLVAVLYSGAQYALAPNLVTNQPTNPAPEYTLGNFSQPLDVIQFASDHGLTLVRDFGNGVVLYRKQAR